MTALFDEVQFPTDIRWGMKGGPHFNTTVLETTEGFEFRNRNWALPLREWDVSQGVKFQSELDILAAFFRARGGRERGFRFKDWSDYKHDMSFSPSPASLGAGDGTSGQKFQIQKTYADAGATHLRPITKPFPDKSDGGTTEVRSDLHLDGSTALSVTIDYDASQIDYSLDTTNGLVTWDSDAQGDGVVTDSSGVISILENGHGLTTSMSVYMTGWTGDGASAINDLRHPVERTDDDNFRIDVDITGLSIDTNSGTWDTRPAAAETMEWTGEFDVPVRFDDDSMPVSIDTFMSGEGQSSHGYTWKKVGIQEVRITLDSSIQHPEVTNVFHEVRFDLDIAYGATGGPGFKTILYTGGGGVESRGQNWTQQRARFDVSEKLKDFEEWISIQEFFNARWGKAFGFRFRDWSDYKHDMGASPNPAVFSVGDLTIGPYQISKTYTSSNSHVRKIRKLATNPVLTATGTAGTAYTLLEQNGGAGEDYTIDLDTGLVTIVGAYTDTSVDATIGATTQFLTSGAHGFAGNESVYIIGYTGSGASLVNGLRHKITVVDADEFTIAVDTLGLALNDDGDIFQTMHTEETLKWTGEFDVPVRFDMDDMKSAELNHAIFSWEKIPLIEIRQD